MKHIGIFMLLSAASLPALSGDGKPPESDPNSYVQGVHLTRNAHRDSIPKMYSAFGCSFADKVASMRVTEYFAVVGGNRIHAVYVQKNTVEPIPAPPASLCPFTLRPVEEVTLTHYGIRKRYKYSSVKGAKWKVEDLVSLPVAKFTTSGFEAMAAARGHAFKPAGWDKVAGIRCRKSEMVTGDGSVEACIAGREELKESGSSFPEQLDMRYVHIHKDGADTEAVEKIDFNAKIPLVRLFPPQSVAAAPKKNGSSAHSRWCAAEKNRTGRDPCETGNEE